MKTLLIGDLHLKSQLILPIVDRIIQTHNIKRVIFLVIMLIYMDKLTISNYMPKISLFYTLGK